MIEGHNLELQHVLTATQYGDKRVLLDAILQRLLRHFNQYRLGNADLYKADMLGDACEYLIKQFADDAGTQGRGATGGGADRPAATLPKCGVCRRWRFTASRFVIEHPHAAAIEQACELRMTFCTCTPG